VIRDHRRPDRLLTRGETGSKKGNRATATPALEDVPIPKPPSQPIVENPFGVHDHDVLCGRGAFVNGHVGNQRLRELAIERKHAFDSGNFSEKRSLATEIVTHIRSLDPPGRFLRKRSSSSKSKDPATSGSGVADGGESATDGESSKGGSTAIATTSATGAGDVLECEWEELPDERAIHKACQVMRDIDRSDRKDREERRKLRKLKKEGGVAAAVDTINKMDSPRDADGTSGDNVVSGDAVVLEGSNENNAAVRNNDANVDDSVANASPATENALSNEPEVAEGPLKGSAPRVSMTDASIMSELLPAESAVSEGRIDHDQEELQEYSQQQQPGDPDDPTTVEDAVEETVDKALAATIV